MKIRIITLTILLFAILNLTGQDLQWLIKNSKGKATSNQYINPITSSTQIRGVKYPKIDANIGGQTINYRNDFFGIFNNGTYHFGRNVPSPFKGAIGTGYCFETIPLNTIKYLYLTNVYEEDELPQMVSVEPGPCTPTSQHSGIGAITPIQFDVDAIPNSSVFALNHDIVHNKDFTIIIDGQKLRDISNCKKFKLCYSINGFSNSDIDFNASNFNTSNYIEQINNQYLIDNSSVNFNNGCFNFIFDNDQNKFFNFNSFINETSIIGKTVNFNLYCENNISTPIATEHEQISGLAHDPNFIQLNSICEIDGEYYANYVIQVQNDGKIPTNSVSLDIEFPSCIDNNDINLQSYTFEYKTDQTFGIDVVKCKKTTPGIIKFTFPIGWELPNEQNINNLRPVGTSGSSVANIEVCARIKDNCIPNILTCTDCLTDFTAESWFGLLHWPIDLRIDLNQIILTENLKNERKYKDYLKQIQETHQLNSDVIRPINDQCNCNLENKCTSCLCPWYYIYCCNTIKWPVSIGILLCLLIFIGLIRKLNS